LSADRGHRRKDILTVGDLDRPAFVALLGPVFEHSAWIADAAWERGPFVSVEHLHAAMVTAIVSAPRDQRLALIRAHPDLGAREEEPLTAESTREQASAGLDALPDDPRRRLLALNRAYRERFGFPFVICARDHDADQILAAAQERLGHDPLTEERVALEQIARIGRLRLDDLVTDTDTDDGAPTPP
jgi:2-oxo-4-hydroxy-4-carboxy-5-ureidoimidazoline decarboxylase